MGGLCGRTVCAVFETLNFDASVSTRIFGVFANVLPGEVCPETVYFCAVVSDEKDEVFSGEVACPASVC